MRRQFILLVTGFSIIALFSSACSGGNQDKSPTDAALTWYGAVITLQQSEAEGLVCRREIEGFATEMVQGDEFLTVDDFFDGTITVSLDLGGVTFAVEDERENWAIVSAAGEVQLDVGADRELVGVDERWYMKLEDGRWRWCGLVEEVLPAGDEQPPTPEAGAGGALSAIDEDALRRRALFALRTLESFRYEGEWRPDLLQSAAASPLEGVLTADGGASTTTADRSAISSLIEKDGTRCTRDGEADWLCGPIDAGSTVYESQISAWIDLLARRHQPFAYKYRQETVNGKPCHLFTMQAGGWESLCLDVETLYPLRHSAANFDPAEDDQAVVYWRADISGYNEPVDIKLPSR